MEWSNCQTAWGSWKTYPQKMFDFNRDVSKIGLGGDSYDFPKCNGVV